jgi:hypothetical protein
MADSSNHEDGFYATSSIHSHNSHSNFNNHHNNNDHSHQNKNKISSQTINSILNPKSKHNVLKQTKNVKSLFMSNPEVKKYFQHKVKIVIALIKIVDFATNRSR